MDFRPPRKAGLTLGSALTVLGFAALAVPMGEAPGTNEVPPVPESQNRKLAAPSTRPPQINIKCKIVEITVDDPKALGHWYLVNGLATNGAIGRQAGPARSNTGMPTAASVFDRLPPGATFTTIPPRATGRVLPSDWRNPFTSPFTGPGVLTDPQFRWVIKALQQRDGSELLAQPEVTTLSGRQAQMKMVTTQRVMTGINERALTPPGITTTNGDESSLYVTESLETGQTLDVTASVLEDGYTIALTVVPRITEFLGYVEDQTNRVAVYVNGKKKWVTPPRPDVRALQGHTSLRVWDGRTLDLGGLLSEKKELNVFVTPTLIDPAGNRVHSEVEMALPRYSIPPSQRD